MPLARTAFDSVTWREPSYSTAFPLTESPISEGGIYTLGGTNGLDWQDVNSTSGKAFGVGSSPGPPYNDCIATVQRLGLSTTKFYTQFTVFRQAGYTAPDSHEIELLFMNISGHVATGYEMDFAFTGGVVPVRWNGAINDFTPNGSGDWTDSGTGSVANFSNGDVVKAVFDNTSGHPVMTIFVNGSSVYSIADTSASKITASLYPGFGFFARAGTGLVMADYCISAFSAGNV